MNKEDLMWKNLTKDNIQKLFNAICKHKVEYDKDPFSIDWDWRICKDCVLSEIVHYVPHGYAENDVCKRNVCFVIWHDRELEVK